MSESWGKQTITEAYFTNQIITDNPVICFRQLYHFWNKVPLRLLEIYYIFSTTAFLTDSSSDDASKEQTNRQLGRQKWRLLRGCSRRDVSTSGKASESVVGLWQHGLSHQVGVKVLEWQDAEVERTPRGEDWHNAESEAGQLGYAWDEARADKAALLANPRESDCSADAHHGRRPHQQAEDGAIEALRVGVPSGDAVEPQHRHVEEGQGHAGEKDVLVVVGHPARLKGAQGFSHLVATAALLGGVDAVGDGHFVHQRLRRLLGTLAALQVWVET